MNVKQTTNIINGIRYKYWGTFSNFSFSLLAGKFHVNSECESRNLLKCQSGKKRETKKRSYVAHRFKLFSLLTMQHRFATKPTTFQAQEISEGKKFEKKVFPCRKTQSFMIWKPLSINSTSLWDVEINFARVDIFCKVLNATSGGAVLTLLILSWDLVGNRSWLSTTDWGPKQRRWILYARLNKCQICNAALIAQLIKAQLQRPQPFWSGFRPDRRDEFFQADFQCSSELFRCLWKLKWPILQLPNAEMKK